MPTITRWAFPFKINYQLRVISLANVHFYHGMIID